MIMYSVFVQCDRCQVSNLQEIFGVPTPMLTMRDRTRKTARDAGWMTVMENDGKKDYCPQCAADMKMTRKAK
jgi:hypothetical protein